MKKYLPTIIPTLVVIAFSAVAIFVFNDKDISNNSGVAVDQKLAGNCTEGDGSVRYVNVSSGNLNIRSGPGTNYEDIGDLSRCTQVLVYCTNDARDWSKISKVSDMWVSSKYLQSGTPSGCSNSIKTTTTAMIRFNLSGPRYTYYFSGDSTMYSNKPGVITYNLTSVTNLANDDDELIKTTITKDGRNVNSYFTITPNYQNGSGTVRIVQANTDMPSGKYDVKIQIGGSEARYSSFTIHGKYYDFSINQNESGLVLGPWQDLWGDDSTPANQENEWKVIINSLTDATNYDAFSWRIINASNVDMTDRFDIERENDKEWRIFNKTNPKSSRPASGSYTFELSYIDPSFSTQRGTLKDTFVFQIDGRFIQFEVDTIVSNRYLKTPTHPGYKISVSRIFILGGEQYITYIEDGLSYTSSLATFRETYTDFETTVINTDASTGDIIYVYSAACTILAKTSTHVTYIDAAGVTQTVTIAVFESYFPGVLTQMTTLTSTGEGYSFDDTGKILYNKVGTKVVMIKELSTKNQTIYAETGGKITFTYNYRYLTMEDFNEAKVTIQKDDDGKTYDADDGFAFSWGKITSSQVVMYLDYTGESIDNIGNYSIYLEFADADTQVVPFSLYDGDVDFYLSAQVDAHYDSEEPLETVSPPGNMDYEYYLGFYMMKGGQHITSKNAKMIDIEIYDRRADLDDDGLMYFYDQVDYEVRIQSYLNGSITYRVTEDGGATYKTVTESYSNFKIKYYEVAELIDNKVYNFDSSGRVISDNLEIHIKQFYVKDGMTDNMVVFTDSAGVEHHMDFATFRIQYPDMFDYVVTTFVFEDAAVVDGDEDLGLIVQGAVLGSYRITEENGQPIEGHLLNDQFEITVDKSVDEIEKAITILPKTEVDAGTYYVYVNYDILRGVGFINNAEEAPISKELYPEMWNQNTHMTMITYLDPVYSVVIDDPVYSNVGNDTKKMYANIEGSAQFDIDYHFIHDFSGVTYSITYNNGTSWVNANSYFEVVNSIDPSSSEKDLENPFMRLTGIPGTVKPGNYRLTINYTNKGVSAPTAVKEFTVGEKFYSLETENNQIAYIHNYAQTKSVLVKANYVSNPENISFTIHRVVSGNNEELTIDTKNKTFTNSAGDIVFKYDTDVATDYYPEDPNAVLFELYLTNVANTTVIGNYFITFSYTEGNNDLATTTKNFSVGEDQYLFTIGSESARANDDGMFIYFDIATEYIEAEYLSNFRYTIYKYDFDNKKYIDVSSASSTSRMFVITDSWDTTTDGNYPGKIQIRLLDSVDLDGSYYIAVTIEKTLREALITNLRVLFDWGISKSTIGSVYEGVNADGDKETIQLNSIYNNLKNGIIDIQLTSVYENDVNWTINRNCIDADEIDACSPEGINLGADIFDDNGNGSGANKHLVLKIKEGITDEQMLEPGTYSLVLYHSTDNFRYVNFEVKDTYAEILIGDPYIYSEVGTSSTGEVETASGLYRNVKGYINLDLEVRGLDYDINLLTIEITNSAGTDVTSDFGIISNTFATDHVIKISYNPSSGLNAGNYMVRITTEGAEAIFSFTIKAGYFNFSLSDPEYTPDRLYPNLEEGGLAKFSVKTENIQNVFYDEDDRDSLNTEKHVIAKNAVITNLEGNNVTSQFNITASNNVNSIITQAFDLNVEFEQNEVEPGYYTIETYYELYDYVIKKSQEFVIGDYVKDLTITRTEVISTTNDGRMHKNISGIYRVHYTTLFDLIGEYFSVGIYDTEGNDVSSYFEITRMDTYVDFKYLANTPLLDSGEYTIILTYQEDSTVEAFITSTKVEMYATYKDITLTNLKQSSDTIYADIEDQYFTFDVVSAAMSETDKGNLIFKVFDSDDNLVYSDLSSDNVRTNSFTITNNLLATSANIKIDVLAFKARVGDYKVVAYLEDEDGGYNYSNSLRISIDYTYYKVILSNKSYIKPMFIYDEDDTETIYDQDGANGYFMFTSTMPASENPVYSIKLYDGLKFVREYITDYETFDDDGIKYLMTEIMTGPIDAANYDFAVCINGLPYAWLSAEVKEYIPVTSGEVIIGTESVLDGGTINVFVGQTLPVRVEVTPENAVDKTFYFSAADLGVVNFNNIDGTMTVSSEGTTEVIAQNSDIEIKFTIVSSIRLASTKYKVDYTNYQIYVDVMTTKNLPAKTFMANLTGVVKDYKLYSTSGVDITSTVTNMATGMSIQNGNERYYVVIIGDINRDGQINVYDVSMLYQHIRRKRLITDKHSLKAADIRKLNNINVYDVSKLYQFVRNKRNDI